LPGGDGVQPPVNEEAVLRLAEPLEALLARGIGSARRGRLSANHEGESDHKEHEERKEYKAFLRVLRLLRVLRALRGCWRVHRGPRGSEVHTERQLDDPRRPSGVADPERGPEGRAHLFAGRVESRRAIDVLELRLVEEIVGLDAELCRTARRTEREVL